MSKIKVSLALSSLILATLACNTVLPSSEPTATMVAIVEPTFPLSQPDLPETDADVPRVSIEKTLVAITAGAAVIVDVRNSGDYAQGHIEGAISIPLSDIETNPAGLGLDKDQWIITYCT
jgi:rhodanese-like protein